MQLNEFRYLLLFLPAVALAAYGLRRARRGQWVPHLLLCASVVFYVSNGWQQLPVLLASITFNWFIAQRLASMEPGTARRRLLQLGLGVNVAALIVFKVSPAMALPDTVSWLGGIGMPLGLSFFTIAQVMFLVDCYERLVPSRGLTEHATFVSYFPNITAGPILRTRLFYSQLDAAKSPASEHDLAGKALFLIALGLVKKVVFGDSFAKISGAGFGAVESLSALEAWITVLSATFEVYFDFSGYSDIALGSAQLLGMKLSRNFDAPFRSATISEFWKRWHITLSDFITTYLYTPLLRRMGKVTLRKSAMATLVAMIIAGVWHGFTWNFAIFGLLHGLALGGYQYWKRLKRPLPRPLDIVATFLFVSVVFITVKAASVAITIEMLSQLVSPLDPLSTAVLRGVIPTTDLRLITAPVLLGVILAFGQATSDRIASASTPGLRRDLVTMLLFVVAHVFMGNGAGTDFRYRQF